MPGGSHFDFPRKRGCRAARCGNEVPASPAKAKIILLFCQRCSNKFVHLCCRSPHGERGLKCGIAMMAIGAAARRSPHGERGLKCFRWQLYHGNEPSLPTRGAWIEITDMTALLQRSRSRSPHGERGLKCAAGNGEKIKAEESLPTRGAWIEISPAGGS